MSIEQPISTNKLNSPDHSLLHRIIASDASAPAESLTVDSSGSTGTTGRKHAVTIKIDTYTATAVDEIIICNKATAMTINLPAASGSGRFLNIKSIGAGAVTTDGDSSDTIDGETTQTLTQWDSMTIIDYASNAWVII